ncbi:MAG: DUF4157 domain-containing protein [Pyrinomonadaceae bacterium]
MREQIKKSSQSNDVMKKHRADGLAQNPSGYFPGNLSDGLTIFRKGSCACGGGCPACQAKSSDLKVSQPNDPAEVEADQMAERVMRMSIDDPKPKSNVSNASNSIHRKCDACEEQDEMAVQRKPLSTAGGTVSNSPEHVRSAISSGGQTLDSATRGFFEPRYGYDLGRVRIHTGDAAAESARKLNASAYAFGQDIVFGAGRFAPTTGEGRTLLAHELAHVVQQQNQPMAKIHRQAIGTCPTVVATRTYSRGNDDWAECNYETARMTVSLVLDTCACDFESTMPLSINYSAVLEGKSFSGRNIPDPGGSGRRIPEQEGQASHIATGVVTPGRSRTGGTQPGLILSESGLPPGTTNTSGTLRLDRDDAMTGGRAGDPGDTVSQELNISGGVACSGATKTGQVSLANTGFTFQTIDYDVSADRSGALSASITLSEALMAGRVATPIIDVTPIPVLPYPPFPGIPRPGGTGCTCNATTGVQTGAGCNRGTGGSGVGRGP